MVKVCNKIQEYSDGWFRDEKIPYCIRRIECTMNWFFLLYLINVIHHW